MERTEPWLVESANVFLNNFVKKNGLVLEYGMGGSTIWFLKNGFILNSIEHDEGWYEKITKYCYENIYDAKLNSQLVERPYNDACPKNYLFFDIILVDGRDRVKCIESSMKLLRQGGILILDNSEREYYQKGIDMMNGWDRMDFKQEQPDKYGFTYPNWTTSIFIKPYVDK